MLLLSYVIKTEVITHVPTINDEIVNNSIKIQYRLASKDRKDRVKGISKRDFLSQSYDFEDDDSDEDEEKGRLLFCYLSYCLCHMILHNFFLLIIIVTIRVMTTSLFIINIISLSVST